MLSYAVIFLLFAVISGVLSFGIEATGPQALAKLCFVVFLMLFVLCLLAALRGER